MPRGITITHLPHKPVSSWFPLAVQSTTKESLDPLHGYFATTSNKVYIASRQKTTHLKKTCLRVCFPDFTCNIYCLSLGFRDNRTWIKHLSVDLLFKWCKPKPGKATQRKVNQGEMQSNANNALLSWLPCGKEAGERYNLSLSRWIGSTFGASWIASKDE